MSFTTTITITPADEKYCGECHYIDGEWGCCAAFVIPRHPVRSGSPFTSTSPRLDTEQDDDDHLSEFLRCPACLAAEKAAGPMLRQCPECRGRVTESWRCNVCPVCDGKGTVPVEVEP
jgi:hypothetical protein